MGAESTDSATALLSVNVIRESAASTTTNTAWTYLPGSMMAIYGQPPGEKDVYVARFTAKSACVGTAGYCDVRIVFGNDQTEMQPADPTGFNFNVSDGLRGVTPWSAHAIDRSFTYLPTIAPGGAVVWVEYRATSI